MTCEAYNLYVSDLTPNGMATNKVSSDDPAQSLSKSLSEAEAGMVAEEEAVLSDSLTKLTEAHARHENRRVVENSRARELTASMVEVRRAEDKQLLASDEAVSHALKDKARLDVAAIETLLKRPYFARVVLEEELESGSTKKIEFKLGFHANSDSRIIDWRRGPLARLYYNYREGEEYSELVQGRERLGTIALRNQVDITNGNLQAVTCRHGRLVKEATGWRPTKTRNVSRRYDQLPDILSLITPEQFDSITSQADSAVLVQGIAGSGKTSVALHRLSWLLHEGNSPLKPAECCVIVVSRALKEYLINSLPHLQIGDVKTYTLIEWCNISLPCKPIGADSPLVLVKGGLPRTLTRVKSSLAFLSVFERTVLSLLQESNGTLSKGLGKDPMQAFLTYLDVCLRVVSNPAELMEADDTRLIDKDSIARLREHFADQSSRGDLDRYDLALMIRLEEMATGGVVIAGKNTNSLYGHIVVDEVQDLSAVELAAVAGGVPSSRALTLVGDTAQAITSAHAFPGWEKLMALWHLDAENSKYIPLAVSHRSTAPIMRLAQFISTGSMQKTREVQGREGRTPIHFHSRREERGVHAAVEWLSKALDRYPTTLTAVLCRDGTEAKYAYSLLKPSFGATVRQGTFDEFSLEDGLLVTTVEEVKGLEFTNVLIWNPSHRSYPKSDEERNLLYVASTRAEENLAIATWERPAAFLPSLESPLVRGIRLDIEEEEEGDR